jgi:hypothetical protein
VKVRYTEEEVKGIADEEAKAKIEGFNQFMNQYLHSIFPNRSVEGLKKLRRSPNYLRFLEERIEARRRVVADPELELFARPQTQMDRSFTPSGELIDEVPRLIAECTEEMGYNVHQISALASLAVSGEEISDALVEWLHDTLPPAPARVKKQRQWRKKNLRRRDFLRFQSLWKRSPGMAARRVLEGREDEPKRPTLVEFLNYWSPILGTESSGASRKYCPPSFQYLPS